MNNNYTIPMLGYGTYQLEEDSVVDRGVSVAIHSGYRLIDTAYFYANEHQIGATLSPLFVNGSLQREDVFLTTKVWNTHHSKARLLDSIRNSLEMLQVDYVDLVLLHFPTGFRDGDDYFPLYANRTIIPRSWAKDAYLEPWAALEEAVRLGLTRSIGVSNFNRSQMKKLLSKAKIKPVLNQVSVFFSHSQVTNLVKFPRWNRIHISTTTNFANI